MSSADVMTAIRFGLVSPLGGGIVQIPSPTPLTRLNYFDGKFLRADDLALEQRYVRSLLATANQAGGSGIAFGLDTTHGAGDTIEVGAGVAVDPDGRVLLLPGPINVGLQELIDRSRDAAPQKSEPRAVGRAEFGDCVVEESTPAGAVVHASDLYLISIGHAEALCGEEDVYGVLCEAACATTTDRPYRVEGVVLRAHPLRLATPLATSSTVTLTRTHLRSLVASASFEDERLEVANLISGDGLRAGTWCFGADAAGGVGVPLAVVGRAGIRTVFFDAWTARRERIEAPASRYWDWRLARRPWDVFLAQVLQFQCQLHDLLGRVPVPGGTLEDPCAPRHEVLDEATKYLGVIERELAPAAAGAGVPRLFPGGFERLTSLRERMSTVLDRMPPPVGDRVLIQGGIVELPSAGYLPVVATGPPSVEDQLRALLGGGVNLTFCTTRRDAVPRAFEEAQHLDRISLLRGLDDPARREDVEIIVPDAAVEERVTRDGWDGVLRVFDDSRGRGPIRERSSIVAERLRETSFVGEPEGLAGAPREDLITEERPDISEGHDGRVADLRGAGRVEHKAELALRWAGGGTIEDQRGRPVQVSVWLDGVLDRDPFGLETGDKLRFSAAADLTDDAVPTERFRASAHGTLLIEAVDQRPDGARVRGTLDGAVLVNQHSDDGTVRTHPWPLQGLDVELRLARTGSDGTVVTARAQIQRRLVVTATLEWYGDADTVVTAVYVAQAEKEFRSLNVADRAAALGEEQARLTLDREPAAATVGHLARAASEEALTQLERAFREPGYADSGRRRLFPAGDDSTVRLRATRDWVLFRRRAVLRCGPVAPVVTTAETFAVYGTMGRGTVIAPTAPSYLGEIAYLPGAVQLATSEAPLLERWRSIAQGQRLAAAAVVAGAPGGDELGKRRVRRLADVLAIQTPLAPGFQVTVVDPDDITLDRHGADGVMLVAARRRAQATLEVGAIAVHPKMVSHYLPEIEAGNIGQAIVMVIEVLHGLGMARFPVDSGDPVDPAEMSAVAQKFVEATGIAQVLRTDVFTIDEDGIASDLSAARGDAIAKAIGDAGPTRTHEVKEEVLGPIHEEGITQRTLVVLTPGSAVRAAVVVIEPAFTARYVELRESRNTLPALDLAFQHMQELGKLGFSAESASPDEADDLQGVAERYQEAGLPEQLAVDVITLRGDPAPATVRKARGQAVLDAVGGGGAVKTVSAFPTWLVQAQTHGVEEKTIILLLPEG